MPASTTGCEHPDLDAVWGAAWRFSPLDLEHLPVDARFVDDAGVQAERDHLLVAQLPDPSLRDPRSPGRFHTVADCDVGKGDAQPYDLVVGEARQRRFPIAFGDDELDRLEPSLTLRIVAIAHADETVTVLREKLLRALLARLEMQADPRGGRLGRAPRWRGGSGGGSGRRDR